ncbi:MAG: DUF2946 family protein [Burkholderiaceae bacterium]
MDDQVMKAMERWPDVPAAYGWLRLDRRGQWYLVDRNQPGFDETVHGDGSLLRNPKLIDFIARNYGADSNGNWFWQNGPQRAYANLDTAPLIVRVMDSPSNTDVLITHIGDSIETVSRACVGPDDVLYLVTEHGPASVHDMDLASLDLDEASVTISGNRYPLETLAQSADQALGFNRRPAQGAYSRR